MFTGREPYGTDRDRGPARLRSVRLGRRHCPKHQSLSAPLGCVRLPVFSRRPVCLPGQCCLRSINQQPRLQHKVVRSLRRLQVHQRNRPGSLRLLVTMLLPQFPGCARAFRHVERRHRVFRARKRTLPKWWRVLRNRDVADRSPFQYPRGLEGRSTRIRASHGTLLRQRPDALHSCHKSYVDRARARVSLKDGSLFHNPNPDLI